MKFSSFLFFLIVATIAFAQRPYYRPNVHELDIQIGAGHWLPGDALLKNETPISISPVNGLRYRYHLGKNNTLRLGGFYRRQNFSFLTKGNEGNFTADYRLLSIEGKIGYERKIDLRKYEIYGGVDAIFGQRSYTPKSSTNLDLLSTIETQQVGGGVFIGFRRFFGENFSIALENEFHIVQNLNEKSLTSSETGINFMQVMLSYHFKRMRKSCACGRPGS